MALLPIFTVGLLTKMPSEDYISTASTGKLKLKGAKDSKITKKKKSKTFKDEKHTGDFAEDNSIMLKKLENGDREMGREGKKRNEKPEEPMDDDPGPVESGVRVKTEAEKRYDEQRRKRVCLSLFCLLFIITALALRINLSFFYQVLNKPWAEMADVVLVRQLDDRLKREGVKTHKQRVEELNRYLSGLSEHHDMPRLGPG